MRGDTHGRILKTARKLFFEEGFSAISTDRLCKEAGVSKSSIYKHFGDMIGVFTQVVHAESKNFSLAGDFSFSTKKEFTDLLTKFGTALLTFINSKQILQFNRLMHAEANLNKRMTEQFYANGYSTGHQQISNLIQIAQDKKLIKFDLDSEEIADYLISMWEGLPYVRARLALTEKPYASPESRAKNCVDILFNK